MLLKTISATGSDVVKIEDYSKGIVLKNIRRDSAIKVDLVSTNGEDRNVMPQMEIGVYADLFTSLTPREQINQTDGTAYVSIYIPFSLAGALAFNEDFYLNVSLTALNNRTIEVHNVDDVSVAPFERMLQVDRHDIKASLSEKKIDTSGYAMAFFPNEEPTKLETYDQNRKVTFGSQQIAMFNGENRIVERVDNGGTISFVLGTSNISFPVLYSDEVTVHKALNEMIMYLVRA